MCVLCLQRDCWSSLAVSTLEEVRKNISISKSWWLVSSSSAVKSTLQWWFQNYFTVSCIYLQPPWHSARELLLQCLAVAECRHMPPSSLDPVSPVSSCCSHPLTPSSIILGQQCCWSSLHSLTQDTTSQPLLNHLQHCYTVNLTLATLFLNFLFCFCLLFWKKIFYQIKISNINIVALPLSVCLK